MFRSIFKLSNSFPVKRRNDDIRCNGCSFVSTRLGAVDMLIKRFFPNHWSKTPGHHSELQRYLQTYAIPGVRAKVGVYEPEPQYKRFAKMLNDGAIPCPRCNQVHSWKDS